MNGETAQECHRALLLAATDEVVAAVLELHKPDTGNYYAECCGCDWGEYAEGAPEWPCTTVKKINEFLWVEGIGA